MDFSSASRQLRFGGISVRTNYSNGDGHGDSRDSNRESAGRVNRMLDFRFRPGGLEMLRPKFAGPLAKGVLDKLMS